MKEISITYYKLPIGSIPFNEIPSLQGFSHQYIYCGSFPIRDFMGSDFYIIKVFRAFDDEVKDIDDLKHKKLLFGQVLSFKLSTRGVAKCLKVGNASDIISKFDLPDLKYSSSKTDPLSGNWFYVKEGKYLIFSAIRSEYEKVKHLEGIALYGDNVLRLRIVIELLKENVSNGILKMSEADYKNIAFKVLRADPTFLKIDDDLIWDGVNNWVPSMLSTPLYEDIPEEKRGKADR
jgi:hypothetical protein